MYGLGKQNGLSILCIYPIRIYSSRTNADTVSAVVYRIPGREIKNHDMDNPQERPAGGDFFTKWQTSTPPNAPSNSFPDPRIETYKSNVTLVYKFSLVHRVFWGSPGLVVNSLRRQNPPFLCGPLPTSNL